MPPQHASETRPAEAAPVPPHRTRRWRRRWLGASVVLAVVAAGVVAAILLGWTGSPPTPATPGPVAAPADVSVTPSVLPDPSASASASPSASASSSARPSASSSARAQTKPGTRTLSGWPNAGNTGVPKGIKLRSCGTRIASAGTHDKCRFDGDVTVLADNVKITRSLIRGSVNAGSGGEQTGLVISDTTIDCGCLADETSTPPAIMESNYTLLRVNIFNAGHGAAVKNNVTIQDSYIHGLGANTDAHKDGIYSGDGSNVVIRHNNIECNDGSRAGCTAAIGLLTDFGPISHWTIDHNLLNTNGSYCFYGSGGPQKKYTTNHIAFVNNHFGRSVYTKCGAYGPVAYFDVNAAGNVWSSNVFDGSGNHVSADY